MKGKPVLLGGIAVLGALALVGATQEWVSLRLAAGAAAVDVLGVSGQDLNPSLSPVAIAVLASVLALTIAGRVFRGVLGVLVALLGAGIAAIALAVLGGAGAAASAELAELTAISGEAQLELIESTSLSPWPMIVLVAGIGLVILGLLVLAFGGRWRTAGRKYETAGEAGGARRSDSEPDRISDWELQNGGDDPSSDGDWDGDEADPAGDDRADTGR